MSEEELENKSGEEEEESEELDVGGSGGLPLEVEINDRYLELVEDPLVRQAMGYVAMNDEGEISASRTRQKLLAWLTEHLKGGYGTFDQSRFRILNYLNTLWLAGCDNLSQEFWWVNRDAVKRLIYILMVSEALHHQQHDSGHSPNKEEIPQAAMFVYNYVANECDDEVFEDLNGEYVELLEENNELCDVYLKCFGEKKHKKHEERGRDHSKDKGERGERRRRKKRD
jgi:hypothetical protein